MQLGPAPMTGEHHMQTQPRQHNDANAPEDGSSSDNDPTPVHRPRQSPIAPRPALATPPTTVRRSLRNRQPRERINLHTMRRALQTAIITTAATMFPATTQFVEFPVVFTTPFSTEGMVQATNRAQPK